jgi:DNA-binding CsgD family transcriptional regulator
VTEIVLSEGQQDSLRRLLSLEATPGALPPEAVLDLVARLVPSVVLGRVRQGRHPAERETLRHYGLADGLLLGFRSGSDHVVQLALERDTRSFSDSDVAMLRMISPVLQRLMRTQPTPVVPANLTTTERRVLQLVATGRSNSEIAADLFVSVATVRKHLENAYRKLGVHSRMAAVVAFEGSPRGRVEDPEPVERYA